MERGGDMELITVENVLEETKRLRIVEYDPSINADTKLFKWWMKLVETEDINEIFHPQNRHFSQFINIMQKPTVLLYSTNNEGDINFAFWISPFDLTEPAAMVSIWADKSIRGTRDLFKRELIVHLAAFVMCRHVYSVTRVRNIELFNKIGYKVVGTLPGFFHDEPGNLCYMIYEKFKESKIFKMFIKEIKDGTRN